MNILEEYVNYHKSRFHENEFVDFVFWSDDREISIIHDFYGSDIDYVSLVKKFNQSARFAAGYMLNPLSKAKRAGENVSRILNIPIDIDKGNEQEKYDKIKYILNDLGIKTSLEDKSQNGYHFIIPVELQNTEQDEVEKFIKLLKQNGHEDVDTGIFDLPRFFRLPNTLNNKSVPPFELQTIRFNEVKDEDIKKNTEIVKEYCKNNELKKSVFETIINTDDSEPDIFFETVLKSEKLKKYISDIDDIEKNNVLFKNLAIYANSHPEIYPDAVEFVEVCNHNEKEFYGWIKKNMSLVNYAELRKWIFEYNLEDLKPLIKKQLSKITGYLANFQICYLKDEKTHRYMLYDKRSGKYSLNKINQLAESLKLAASEEGFDIIDELDIFRFDDKGNKISETKLMNMIPEVIYRINERASVIRVIDDFGYKPTNEQFFDEGNKKYFNIYTPGPYEHYYDKKDKYEFTYIEKLLKHLTTTEEGYEYFNKWLAFILQNPTTKLPTSIIFKGTQGTGKGRLREWILPMIWGDHNIEEINDTNLKNIWGDYVKDNRFVIANEINLTDNSSNAAYKRIKEYSTDKKVSIQQKGKQLEKVTNYTHWLFFSDQEMPVRLEEEDRRHTIFHQEDKLNLEITKKLSPEINPGYLEKEIKEYVSYLRSIKVEFEEVVAFLKTEAKEDLLKMNVDSVQEFYEEFKGYQGVQDFITEYAPELNLKIDKREMWQEKVISVKDFYITYERWCGMNSYRYPKGKIQFGKSLSKMGLNSMQRKIKGNNMRIYEVA